MNTLLTPLLLILFTLPSYASDLPPCPKDQTQTYDNCFSAITFPDGAKYAGEFKNGKYHGKGTFTFTDGDKYIGEWKDDAIHGQGTMIYADGRVYKGKYKAYARTQGTMEWPNGLKYTGKWGEDGQLPNGFGAYTFSDGTEHFGLFQNGVEHGLITVTHPDGRTESGIWADGKYLYKSVESARSKCAEKAGKAGTEYAAKQIEKTCLAEKGLEPES